MWKPLGYLSTLGLMAISVIALGIAAWFYDSNNLNDAYSTSDSIKPYIDGVRAIIACDLLMFVTCFLGVFFLVKPSAGSAKFYCLIMVLLIVFKIVVGAIWYSGVNDTGKNVNSIMQAAWDACAKFDSCTPPDALKAWHTQS